ncbi:MAG TPA: hypothetical protein VGP76_30940 [Planctomycetaceae bacterium]|nr:hypothetical protein [Planctomycetaceae bacterium]
MKFLSHQFLQDGDLPFGDVLSEGIVAQALKAVNVCSLDRIYSALVTLWVCLGLLRRGVDSLQALERLDFGHGYLFPALDLPPLLDRPVQEAGNETVGQGP